MTIDVIRIDKLRLQLVVTNVGDDARLGAARGPEQKVIPRRFQISPAHGVSPSQSTKAAPPGSGATGKRLDHASAAEASADWKARRRELIAMRHSHDSSAPCIRAGRNVLSSALSTAAKSKRFTIRVLGLSKVALASLFLLEHEKKSGRGVGL
jgi:hypothetical protein